jgi:competence protein ComEC
VLVPSAGAITAALLWIAVLNLPDGRLHVFFLDMGHSNAVLIRTPGGSTVLVDGGQYPTRLLTALGDHLPFWERDLALLVLTQPKPSQVTALPAILERYRVAQILTNGQQPASETVLALYQTAADQHIPVQAVFHGYTAETSDGVRLEVLYPFEPPAPDSKPEEAGLVLRLTYGEASFLLTPDLDPSVEQALLNRGIALHGTVLELASHGSGRVSGEPFLTAVSPQVAVVQVEPGNRSGLPAPEVVDRLGAVPLFRTDTMSEIAITTDGRTLWIDTARQP